MRRLLLLLIALVVLPATLAARPAAEGRAWQARTIPVYDYTGPRWDGVIAQTVVQANAILPRRGPEVVYHRRPATDCGDVGDVPRAIVVCETDGARWGSRQDAAGVVWWGIRRGTIRAARVELRTTHRLAPGGAAVLACHEVIGHAILGLPDGPDRGAGASCVQGTLAAPGTWDVAQAGALYGHRETPRRHRGHHR